MAMTQNPVQNPALLEPQMSEAHKSQPAGMASMVPGQQMLTKSYSVHAEGALGYLTPLQLVLISGSWLVYISKLQTHSKVMQLTESFKNLQLCLVGLHLSIQKFLTKMLEKLYICV